MRLLVYSLVLLLLLYAPVKRLDVAKLEPIEVVCMDVSDGTTLLLTDTEAWGRGANAYEALEDMRSRTAGVIYLDTAVYLLVTEAAVGQVDDLRSCLKGTVRLCITEETNLTDMARFLEVHGPLPRLNEWKTGEKLPMLKDGKIIG